MDTRSDMGAFLENPMFLFVDDVEPIVPIFRSTVYGDTGRIVELADVGCDTDTTFPIHFPRGASDRRRGGAESFKSTRRIAKWLNDKPNEFSRTAADVNNNEGRNRINYVRGTTRRDDYDDMYIDDLDYDDSYAQKPYNNLELPRNNSPVEEDDYYAQFVNPRNAIARSRRERIPRYDYLRDLEASFTQGIRVPQRESTSPRWFAENDGKNIREMRGTNVHLSERRKRTKILSRPNGSFNRETEFGKAHETVMHRERDNLPNAADPIAPMKNTFWDFISFENDAECEETTFCNPTRTKNHDKLQKMAPHGKRSYIFDSPPKRVDTVDSEGEEEFKETLKKDRRENLSPEIPINSARYRTSKGDTVKEKSKLLRVNASNAFASRGQSMKAPIDKRISNVYLAEKNSINTRPCSATEGKKIKSQTIERREEITSATVDERRYRDKFDKLSNNPPKETSRSTRTFNRIADSKSNGRIYTANEGNNTNPHRGNSGNSKMDRINVTVSRLAPEEKVTKNERTFALRMTGAAATRTDMEKKIEKKFFSRLPIRTWKRSRTKEPATSRPENDATNGDVNRKLQQVENETAKSNDHSERVENDDVRVKDRAAANRNDVKRSQGFGTGSLSADKPGLISSNLKGVRGIKGLNTAKGTHEQRKKKTNVK
ncbi:uncharacterized protein [Temnothorax nylanderi]|uniref:uncharacterized protein n=1 Tax=Temnothorax nylanderi TaxID=102681 RepID=UPI003A85B100